MKQLHSSNYRQQQIRHGVQFRLLQLPMMESLIHVLILLLSLDFSVCRDTAFHIQPHIRSTKTTNRKHVIISQQHKNIPRHWRKHRESIYTKVQQQQQHLIPQRQVWMGLGMNNDHDEREVTTSLPTTTTATNQMMNIQIEYCTGCKWNLRAHWMAQELLHHYSTCRTNDDTTSNDVIPTEGITVSVIPSTIAGTFRISIGHAHNDHVIDDTDCIGRTTTAIWDRTIDIGFPEFDELLEKINEYSLSKMSYQMMHLPQPHISIQYIRPNDVFRASYIGQEILSTFHDEVKAVSYTVVLPQDEIPTIPTVPTTSQYIKVILNDSILIYTNSDSSNNSFENSNKNDRNRFISIKELKQLIRDQINPNKHLGHSDVAVAIPTISTVTDIVDDEVYEDDDDNDNAAGLARNYFGVA